MRTNQEVALIVSAVSAHMVRYDLPIKDINHLFALAADVLARACPDPDAQEQIDDAIAAAEADAIVGQTSAQAA